MFVSKDIRYIGVNDHKIDLFEGQYEVPLGMAYNSYVILDERIAVMDSVEQGFGPLWLEQLDAALAGRQPDYLVVQHVEPDHSGSIASFLSRWPDAVLVGNAKTFSMLEQFYGLGASVKKLTVKNGDRLELGSHSLRFTFAPMVHWPEVMVSYDEKDHVLFSADAFGKFGANDVEDPEGWACEARRYYFGIVGKYGQQVERLLGALDGLELAAICPLHGPVLSEDLGYYLGVYKKWASYTSEDPGVLVAYTSVYGNTRQAAETLGRLLEEKGCPKVSVMDLAREDMYEAVEDAFRYSHMVLATITYNGGVFPWMREFIGHLTERGYRNRTVAFIENGTWAPMAGKVMRGMLSECRDLTLLEETVTIRSALSQENREALARLADALWTGAPESEMEPAAEDAPMKKWVCTICGYIYEGAELPEDFTCPLCHQDASFFEPME